MKKHKAAGTPLCRLLRLCLPALAALCAQAATAADDGGLWEVYPSYNGITEIEPTGSGVFVLAANSLFSYNTADGSITTYDKTNTLSDAVITHIAWVKGARRLAVAYANSDIDLVSANGSTINVPDLYMYTTNIDKTINSIYTYDRYAYMTTGFGIIRIDASNGDITESYRLGFSVDYCYIDGGRIYAASADEGLYAATLGDNLADRNNWERVGGYVPRNDDRTNVYDAATGYWWTTTADGRLTYYTADASGNRTYLTEGVLPDGPASNNFYHIYMNNGKLYGVGGVWNQITDGLRPGEVHVLGADGEWSEFEKPTGLPQKHNYWDLLCMDFDPADPEHVMVGAKSGLYEFRGGKFVKAYNGYNSPVVSPYPESDGGVYNYAIVSSVKYDAEGNLWVLNPQVTNSIKRYTQSTDEWTEFSHQNLSGLSSYDLEKLFISPTNGMMWFVNNFYNESRLFAYNPGTDELASYGPSFTNQNGTAVEPHYIYTTVEDRLGNVWIGTDVGPIYLAAADIRSGSDTFTQYAVPRNDGTNYADYLLSGIDIRAIAVDGGNRKWIGTNGSGVFLISDDNNTQLQHFTTDNSPLMSDIVHDIAVDGATGRVYFATENGLCSYRADATEPSDKMTKDNVYAYPNPVRPDYSGPITIVGLTYGADVKIVTVNGTLVSQGRSTGGTFTWDGCDLDGRRVASGVYMVETATSTGEKGTVCKIAVIN